MCHRASNWSEIQYPHQNLIYDQPAGRGWGKKLESDISACQGGRRLQDAQGGEREMCIKEGFPSPLLAHKHNWDRCGWRNSAVGQWVSEYITVWGSSGILERARLNGFVFSSIRGLSRDSVC